MTLEFGVKANFKIMQTIAFKIIFFLLKLSIVSFIQMPQYNFFTSLSVPVYHGHVTWCSSRSMSEGKEVLLLSWEQLTAVQFWAWPSWRYFWTPCWLLSLGKRGGAARGIFLRSRAWKSLIGVGWLHSLRWKGTTVLSSLILSLQERMHMLTYTHFQASAQAKLSQISALSLRYQEKERKAAQVGSGHILRWNPSLVLCTLISTKRAPKCSTQKTAMVGHWKLAQDLASWAVFVQGGLHSTCIWLLEWQASPGSVCNWGECWGHTFRLRYIKSA